MSALCCGRFTPERSESHPARVYGAVSATGFGGRCRAIGFACRWSIRIAGIDHIRGTRVRAQTVGSCIVTWELAMSWPEVDLVLDVRVRALGDQARDQARTVGCICVYIETRI